MIRILISIMYAIISVVQFFATFSYFATVHDMNGFLSFILAIITCWIPLLGTILGVLGAHDGWGWSWSASLLLFVGPFIVLGLLSLIGRGR
jgi:hypothetical protein